MRNRNRPQADVPPVLEGEQRINKILAAAGLGARRQVDELIEQGRVEIDGKTVQQVGIKVNPETSTITVDGEPLKKHRPVYFALHKPEGVLCTNRDPQGRARVVDMVPNQVRLFPVGRLDASSTGLILLTNNGELAQRLTHPRHGVPKRYAVIVAGHVEVDSLKRLQRGIYLAEGRARVDQAKMKRVRKGSTEIEITLSEGKNREIRRVLARLGHKVLSLKRVGIGPLKLGDLPEGAYRPLSAHEVAALYEAVEEIKRTRRLEKKARKKLGETKAKASRDEDVDAPDVDLDDDQDDDERLPSMALNPYRTEEDFDDDSDEFGPDAILVRDHATDDEDDSWSDMPGQRAGVVIDDEDAELIRESRSVSESKPKRRRHERETTEEDHETAERPKGKSGKKPLSGRGQPRNGPARNGTSRSSPRSASPRSASPRSASPRSASPRSASPRSGAPRSGAPRAVSTRQGSVGDAGREGTEADGTTGLGSTRQGAARKGPPRKGPPRKSSAQRGSAQRDSAQRDPAPKDPSRKGVGRKGGSARKGFGSKGPSAKGFAGPGKRRGAGKKRRPSGR